MNHLIRATALRQGGCIAVPQAVQLGAPVHQLNDSVRDRGWRRPHRRVLGLPDADPSSAWYRAWAAVLTQWRNGSIPLGVVAGYETSLRLWIGSDAVPATNTDHLIVPSDYTGHSRSTVKLHQLKLEPAERTLAVPNTRPGEPHFAELPSATAARSVLDFARRRRRDDAVVIADTALRVGAVTKTSLTSGLGSLIGLPHVEKARTAVLLTRPGTDSAMETLTRLRLVDAGLPCPTVDYRIVSPTGVLLARGELVYDALLVWIEYDGYADHVKRHVFRAERRRHRWLESRGWKVVRCVDVDILDSRSDFVGDVAAALADAPRRIAALSPTLSPEAAAARARLGLGG